MKRKISLLLALSLLILSVFTACSSSETNYDITLRDNDYDWTRFMDDDITLNVYNWGMYISNGEKDTLDTVQAFEALTGIDVNYTTFDTNEGMYSKVNSGAGDYDIVIPSDYMISKMANEGLLAELDFDNIPNYDYIGEDYRGLSYDPDELYSVAYTWGLVGIIYNTTMVEEEDIAEGWDIFWNEDYEGQVLMFNNSRDAFAIAAKYLGQSLNPTTVEEITAQEAALKEQKSNVQSYVMDEVFDKMIGGEAAIAAYYIGDGMTMMDDNEDLEIVIPEEGTNMYVDAMCVLESSQNKEAAEMFINFMCETEVALANIEYICYSTPHTEAYELLDEETQTNELMYPSQEILDNCESFLTLSDEINSAMDSSWSLVRGQDADGDGWMMIVVLVLLVAVIVFVFYRRAVKKKRNNY
ncbi:MAG: ABC transporter substrate-binding protein [Clostridia bacterium]